MDVLLLALVAGGATFQPAPFEIEGLHLEPSIETLSSQVTGDDVTTLVIRRSGGRVRCVESTTDFVTAEDTIAVSSGHAYQVSDAGQKLASGYAVWMTAVAVQHRPTGAVEIVYVPGTVALLASVAVATQEEIQDWVDPDGVGVQFVILGDALFYRSADTVITVRISEERRPAYVHEDNKTGVTIAQDDQDSLAGEFCCYMNVPADLTSISAIADDDTYIANMPLPNLPFGGFIKGWRYVPTVAGVGAGATNDVRLAIDGVDVTDGTLTITEANTAIGQGVGDFSGLAANTFLPGATLDIEVDTTATAFTGGSGFFQIEIWKYVK